MIQRHCGIDLNGWRDTAARSWTVGADGDVLDHACTIDGGIHGSLAQIGDADNTAWIGGYQAALAPHGRGPGWGEIGDPARRVSVRALLQAPNPDKDLIGAVLAALAGQASHAALALDDTPSSDEEKQDELLAAMHTAGLRRRLLVWRSVLTVLAFLKQRDVVEGSRIGVINHVGEGFAVQSLKIRRETGRSHEVLAPERHAAGVLCKSAAGYAGLDAAAAATLANATETNMRCELPRAVGRLALGFPAPPEILLNDMRRWVQLDPPTAIHVPQIELSIEGNERLEGCDVILFETLAEGDVRSVLLAEMGAAVGPALTEMPSGAVAFGGMEAARRLACDEPVYFDYLPQISTIVIDGGTREPSNFDLIERGATLPAGRIYRSPRPARLGLDPGQEHLSFYLKRENAEWPRRARIDLGTNVVRRATVELFVEQAPLEGSARIMLRSPALARQFVVDWNKSEELHKDWLTVIAEMDRPKPTVPNRLVLPCGMEPWEDGNTEGLLSLLDRFDGQTEVDWKLLAARLASRPSGKFCISSDGEIPANVRQDAIDKLDRLTARATTEELERFESRLGRDNDRLRFLLWQFRRCPPVIVDALVNAMENASDWQDLFDHWSHWKMIYQGVGRCVDSRETESRIVEVLYSRPEGKWKWWRENACLSFILSRSDTGPEQIDRKMLEVASVAVVQDFWSNIQNEKKAYTTFFYAPFLLVGLLRWRMIHPWALIEGQDRVADQLAAVVLNAAANIKSRAYAHQIRSKYLPILDQILDELKGEGSNPDLLMDIFGGEEDKETGFL